MLSQTIVALGAALALAWWLRPILVPITIAWLFKVALTPAVRAARRRGLPTEVTAAVLLVVGSGLFVGATSLLAAPVGRWIEGLPRDLETLTAQVRDARGEATALDDVSEKIEEMSKAADGDEEEAVKVEVKPTTPPVLRALASLRSVAAQALFVFVLLYFLLATDRTVLAKAIRVTSNKARRRIMIRVVRAVETSCARYVVTISAINLALGIAVGLACWATGLRQPLLWGAMAAVVNFVPFLGAMVGISIVAVAGATTIESWPEAFYPAAAYLALTTLEGMVITPAIVGRMIRMSPVVVLIWLFLWGWLWGVAGALLAMPMLAAAVLVCRNVPEWRPLAVLVESGGATTSTSRSG